MKNIIFLRVVSFLLLLLKRVGFEYKKRRKKKGEHEIRADIRAGIKYKNSASRKTQSFSWRKKHEALNLSYMPSSSITLEIYVYVHIYIYLFFFLERIDG